MPTCPCQIANAITKALFHMREAKRLTPIGPEQTSPATVLSRTVQYANDMDTTWLFLVTFRLENGEELQLQTTEEGYGALKEEMSGQLTWQDKKIVDFVPKDCCCE